MLLILLVVFGWPQQMPTILGLTTAGLTIALQDFILAFFGWFVLMGKNGIRVGDWVEINGVGGEVTEIGLMSTTLLETGDLADKAIRPAAASPSSTASRFAGKYFNFSTAGQWMWDEITVSIPQSGDTHTMVEQIHKRDEGDGRECPHRGTGVETRHARRRPEPIQRGASGQSASLRIWHRHSACAM